MMVRTEMLKEWNVVREEFRRSWQVLASEHEATMRRSELLLEQFLEATERLVVRGQVQIAASILKDDPNAPDAIQTRPTISEVILVTLMATGPDGLSTVDLARQVRKVRPDVHANAVASVLSKLVRKGTVVRMGSRRCRLGDLARHRTFDYALPK